jgi:hypothetical protein
MLGGESDGQGPVGKHSLREVVMSEHTPEETQASEGQGTASGPNRKAKWVFGGAALAMIVFIYWLQTRPPTIEDWGSDLEAALTTARQEDRPVVALIDSDPPSEDGRFIVERILKKAHNRQAVEAGRYVPVRAGWSEEIGRRFEIDRQELPVLLILDGEGEVLRRHVGRIGEMQFRGFLEPEGGSESGGGS